MSTLAHAGRNAIFTALFKFVTTNIQPPPGSNKWNTTSQQLVPWDDVNAAQQPALFLFRSIQTASLKATAETRWHWRASIWMYYRVDGVKSTNTYPDQMTDAILDNIETVFQGDLNSNITLGGLVQNVFIDGSVVYDSGLTDGQAIIVVPLSIYV